MGMIAKRVVMEHEEQEQKASHVCCVCGRIIDEGYFNEDTGDCYCSDECLLKEISWDEYEEAYDEGYMFWTEW